ncbi:MAG: FAD-binding protein [Flavobacteriales bacterium]|nr:FAD-binding protein [Flavobacteriales bacterium]
MPELYKKIGEAELRTFADICGEAHVYWEPGHDWMVRASRDETEDLCFVPEAVARPGNAEQVAHLLRYCHVENIPVTPRGAGTGLSGGALPVCGGLVLDTSRMNRILKLDTDNFTVTVEPGVITQHLQEVVAEKDLFYPPDPSSRGSCFIGGNIAENAGGPRAVKYGTTKDFVLNLKVVLADGTLISTGAATLKNATGYNLTQLFVGSEGTLGVVTEATLKLLPHPRHRRLMLANFESPEAACETVAEIFKAGFVPSALEFMEREAMDYTLAYKPDISLAVPERAQAQLLVETDGLYPDVVERDCEGLYEVLEKKGAFDILYADDEAGQANLWRLRRAVGEAVKSHSIYKEEDTVVPRFELPRLLRGVKEIGSRYGFRSVCYGHAGDGNLHVNILKGDLSDTFWNHELPEAIAEIFQLCKRLGGTISGEHGIGWVQRRYMPLVFSEAELQLMKSIKKLLDPKNILNPGKIF